MKLQVVQKMDHSFQTKIKLYLDLFWALNFPLHHPAEVRINIAAVADVWCVHTSSSSRPGAREISAQTILYNKYLQNNF